MNIVRGTPPNFDAIVKAFPAAAREGVIFTHGDTVYVNGEPLLPPQLKAHEAVHVNQQQRTGTDRWWELYLAEPEFRYEQELIAHRAEYRTLKHLDRNYAARSLNFIASRLASPLYGSVVTVSQAKRAILA